MSASESQSIGFDDSLASKLAIIDSAECPATHLLAAGRQRVIEETGSLHIEFGVFDRCLDVLEMLQYTCISSAYQMTALEPLPGGPINRAGFCEASRWVPEIGPCCLSGVDRSQRLETHGLNQAEKSCGTQTILSSALSAK